MKKTYENPVLAVEDFETVDCISASYDYRDDGIEFSFESLPK